MPLLRAMLVPLLAWALHQPPLPVARPRIERFT
jgi:hypothetical protein